MSIIISTISGVGHTTATTVAAAFYSLLQNPWTLDKLHQELDKANWPIVPSYTKVKVIRISTLFN
jgi:cytochrome P450